jgi:hypothetical protein
VIGVLAFAGSASAATMISATGTPLSEMIKTNSGGDGNLNNFFSDPSHLQVDYSSTSTLSPSSQGGFAYVQGVSDNGFADLTLTPDGFSFSDLKFNLKLPAAEGGPAIPNGYKTDFSFDTTVYFSGGGMQTFSNAGGNGENRFLITGGIGEAISKVVFSNLVGVSTKNNDPTLTNGYNFDSLRQVSFDQLASGVPEPSTWALFILGFGAIGLMMRGRRQTVRA